MAKKYRPEMVIMDVSMPRLNGIEATKQIKAMYPNMAILVLTGYDDDEYVFALLEAGAAGYLLKESSGEELIDAIRQVMTGEPVLHPKIMRKVLNRLRSPGEEQASQTPGEVLSDRELEVLKLAAKGMSNMEIADSLTLSVRTVQTHLRLQTRIADTQVKEGDPVEIVARVRNTTKNGLPMTMVLVGLPGGLEPRHERLKELVKEGKFQHDGNPVLRWNISNTMLEISEPELWKPSKKKSTERIDGAVALICALSRSMVHADTTSVYETRGILTL